MNFPINFRKQTYLNNSGCDLCGNPLLNGEFVTFHIGEDQDCADDNTLDVSNIEIAMGLGWQGQHPNMGTGFQE
jgi:hypothetical protein